MKSLGALVLAALVSTAWPVSAKQASPMTAREALDRQSIYAERFQRQAMDGPTEREASANPDQNPRRARRAQAAADLINAGNCDGALALAQSAHDLRLEARIRLICVASSASIDAASPAGSF